MAVHVGQNHPRTKIPPGQKSPQPKVPPGKNSSGQKTPRTKILPAPDTQQAATYSIAAVAGNWTILVFNFFSWKITGINLLFILHNLQKLCKTIDSNQALEEAEEREDKISVNDQEMAER